LGTPDENVWSDFKNLANYKESFPKWESAKPELIFPNLEPNGIHLLTRMLCYVPNKRITAKQALLHVIYII
jgi:cyclin-dependent kinase 2